MTKKLNIGILGGGGILNAHAPGFAEMAESAQVVAVAEPNPTQSERLKKMFGAGVALYTDYEELLERSEVDAVDILLPHDLHLPAVQAAAAAGKDILVEKVMGRNVAECDAMIDACETAGVSLTISHDRRYNGYWMALKRIIDSGVLGRIRYWKLDHNQDVNPPEGHWIRSSDKLGGGAIMSCLTHQIDALRWYGGEPATVTCMTCTEPSRMEGEFAGAILATMRSGALAQLSINWWTKSNGSEENALWYEMVQVCGDSGEAYLMNNRGVFLRQHDHEESEWSRKYGDTVFSEFIKVESGDYRGHVRCIKEWVNSLRGEPAEITTRGRDCRGTVEVAQAAYISEREGRAVALPLTS